MSGPTIAVAGGSGALGKHIIQALTSANVRSKFSRIIVLSRQADYSVAGATTRQTSDSADTFVEALQGVDVVINALSTPAYDSKVALVHAIAQVSSVKLYFPSEFGVDHRIPDPDGMQGTDSDFEHREWIKKKKLLKLAHDEFAKAGRDVKICNLFVSFFMEHSFGPWVGLSVKKRRFEAVCNADQHITWTTMDDIGKALTALSLLPPNQIPLNVRVSGDAKSIREVAAILDEVANDGTKIEVEQLDLETKRKYAHDNESKLNPAGFIVIHMGTGKLDFGPQGLGNDNELVNPGEKSWKWKTVRDYAQEVGGRPYADR